MKVKTKELFGQMKKVKASVTAESADKNRAAPKKMEFSLFSKSKSADTGDKGGEKERYDIHILISIIYKHINGV